MAIRDIPMGSILRSSSVPVDLTHAADAIQYAMTGTSVVGPQTRLTQRLQMVDSRLMGRFDTLVAHATPKGNYYVFGCYDEQPFLLTEENPKLFPSDDLVAKIMLIGG